MVYNIYEQCGIRGKRLQYLAVFGANIAVISQGMHFGWPSTSIPILTNGTFSFKLSPDEGSVLVSMVPIGAIFGSVLGEYTIDIVGRKNMILNSMIPLTISWLMIALGPFKYFYFVSRFLAGMVEGFLYTSIPPYISEISDSNIRGIMGCTFNLSIVVGMLFINVLYFFLDESIIIAAYVAAALSVITLVIVPFMPESPYFYVLKRDMIAAENSLKRFKGKTNVREDLNRIYTGLFNEDDENTDTEFCIILRKYKKCLLISIGLIFIQHMSGFKAIESYCESLFIGQKFILPKVANVIYFLTYFLATLNSLFWVDFCGRKPLILFSISISCLALFSNATYLLLKSYLNLDGIFSDYIELFSVIIFTSAYSVGLHTIPVLVTSEIFPTNLKPKAHCIANIGLSLFSACVLLMFSWLSRNVGLYVPFFIFGIHCLFGVFFIIKFMPETKHKTLEEIQIEMKNF